MGVGGRMSATPTLDESRSRSKERAMATIKVRKNGPYLVTGGVELTDAEGNPIEAKNKDNYTLCRCGYSQSKPFCDGAHKAACFDDE
jgi:hypothetical protein